MTEKPHVYQAINAVQKHLAKHGIGKDRENKFDHYKFRGIDDVYNALAPALAEHGLVVMPRMLQRDCVERASRKGDPLFYVTVEAEFDFVSSRDGSQHTVRTFGEAMDRSDKATNKAMSAAYKYACFQTFCIPTEGDNDSENDTPAPRSESNPKAKPPATNGRTHLSPFFKRLGSLGLQDSGDWDAAAANWSKICDDDKPWPKSHIKDLETWLTDKWFPKWITLCSTEQDIVAVRSAVNDAEQRGMLPVNADLCRGRCDNAITQLKAMDEGVPA